MIPAYTQPVDIPEIPHESDTSVDQQIQSLQNQVMQLRQSVDYLLRENNRLKSDVQTLTHAINRK